MLGLFDAQEKFTFRALVPHLDFILICKPHLKIR